METILKCFKLNNKHGYNILIGNAMRASPLYGYGKTQYP